MLFHVLLMAFSIPGYPRRQPYVTSHIIPTQTQFLDLYQMSNALISHPGRPLSTVSLRTFFESRCKSRQERQLWNPYVMIPSRSHSWAPALLSPPSLSLYPSRSVMNSSQCLVTSSLVCCGKGLCPSATKKSSFLLWLPADGRGTKPRFILAKALSIPAEQRLPGYTQLHGFSCPAGLW